MKENNKLIAEFMGYSQPNQDYPNTTYWYKKGKPPLTLLLYNISWGWLMPVVNEINSKKENILFKYGNGKVSFWFYTNPKWQIKKYNLETLTTDFNCSFTYPNPSYSDNFTDYNTEIEAVYKAVIELIKWYNKNKK